MIRATNMVYIDDMILLDAPQNMLQAPAQQPLHIDHPDDVLPPIMMIQMTRDMAPSAHCLICAYGDDGVEKTSGCARFIVDMGHHEAYNPRHQRYLQQGRQLLPHVAALATYPNTLWMVAPHRTQVVFRCKVCSLDGGGNARRKFSDIEPASVQQHLNSAPHLRRCLDGRYALRGDAQDHM
jgi:hypothetical protein